jgi:hypothetical protein
MARVGTNDEQFTVPSHKLAVFTDPFNARSHLHRRTLALVPLRFLGNRYYNDDRKKRQAYGTGFAMGDTG